MAWLVYRQEAKKDLKNNPLVSFLGGLEGKK